eukprot:scaffold28661_cov14-Prasinocladus_malaysianus.AAC.1
MDGAAFTSLVDNKGKSQPARLPPLSDDEAFESFTASCQHIIGLANKALQNNKSDKKASEAYLKASIKLTIVA